MEISASQLNAMNQLLFQMRALKSNQLRPVFSIEDIVDAWHADVDDTTPEATIVEILETGASTGFFLFYQCLNGSLFYGYNAQMLKFNKANKQILVGSLAPKPCLFGILQFADQRHLHANPGDAQ